MKYYYLVLCWILAGSSYGRQIKDTVRYNQMLNHALHNYDELGDSLVDYANSFIEFSKTHSYPEASIKAYKILGLYHEINGAYDSALHHYNMAEQMAHKFSNEEVLVSVQFDKTSVYLALQQNETAKQCLITAMERLKKNNNQKLMAVAWSNIGIIYRRTGKTDSAYYAYSESMRIKELLGDSVGIANTRINLASLLTADHKYMDALNLLQKNIEYYKQQNRSGELWYAYMSSSEAWRGLNNLSVAEQYIDSAARIAIQYDMPQHLPTQLKLLAAIAYDKGNYRHAYEMLDSASRTESITINDATRKQVTELTEKFKVKQKEQQNKLLTTQLQNKKLEQRNLLYVLIALASIALVVFIAWINIRRKRTLLMQQHREIEYKNEQLISLNEDKNQLISMVSHDLAQPLQQARVWMNILQKQLSGNNETSEPLDHVTQSIEKGQQLINNVLQVEKLTSVRNSTDTETIDLHRLFENMLEDFSPAAAGKNIRLQVEGNGNGITLNTNRQSLVQVLENLLSNAIKFSEAGTAVTLSAATNSSGTVTIAVKDEGPGIGEADRQAIFNKYAIGNARPTAGEHSTGLGLNIVKRLMLEMGGTVEVENAMPKGSVFKLIFKPGNI